MNNYIAAGGLISLGTITATGLSISYQFQTNSIFEGLQAALSLAPQDFYFYVDLGTDELYFEQASQTATVTLTKGYHLDQVTIIASVENIVNYALFSGGIPTGDTTNVFVAATNPQSIALYGQTMDRLSDTNVTDTGTALTVAQNDINNNSTEQNQTTVTVLGSQYDLTLFKPGMTVGFNGFGTFVDSLILQIARIDYTPEEATLTLGVVPQRTSLVIDQLIRGLIGQESIANPSTPSFNV